MPQGGTIRVESGVEQDTVTVRICDQGTGIAPQNLERIFEPFFTTKGPRGTGLGLSLARKVMETIGGGIAATNQPAGDGAVFTLKFSVARLSNSGIQAQEHTKCSYSYRFLIVDDDVENLDALKEVLISGGHSVDTAMSGAEALEKLRLRSDYDVVLCDLNMPGTSGSDVARRSSEFASTPEFFIVTGWDAQARSAFPPNSGVSAILTKPIGLADIDRIVETVNLKRSRKHVSTLRQ
jgi:CheY-like chemotaxis protein